MNKNITHETRTDLLKIIKDLTLSDMSVEEIESNPIIQLGVDSMAILQISYEFENTHSLKIDIDNISSDTTVGQMIDNLISMPS